MRDVEFKNTADVRWNDTFDSYQSTSNVNTEFGSEMTIGVTEVLASISAPTTNVQGVLSLGIVEILASTIPTTSSSIVDLYLGLEENISSGVNIESNVDSFINVGVAEGLSSTSYTQANVTANLSFGIVELLGSSIIIVSNIESTLTLGVIELVTSHNVNIVSLVTGTQISTGVVELLASTSPIESVISGFMIFGVEEVAFASCDITTDAVAELTLGIGESLSATSSSEVNSIALITTGIAELLASTSISISIATGLSVDLGVPEPLTSNSLVNSNIDAILTMGLGEPVSSSIDISTETDGLLTIGIVELLAVTAAITTDVVDSSLDLGQPESLSSTALVDSSVSVFLILGITEPLSGSTHAQSFIRKGGDWADLIIGHTELLSHTCNILSIVSHTTLDLGGGIEELAHTSIIPEDVIFRNTTDVLWSTSYRDYTSLSYVHSILTIGHVELASSVAITTSSVLEAELIIGIDELLSASVDLEIASSAFILMGTTEQLSASINIDTSQTSLLLVGQIELLSTTIFSISITDADIFIGGSEIQTGTATAQSNTYAILVIGRDESLSATQEVITTTSNSLLSIGVIEILAVSLISSSDVEAEILLGTSELLNSTSLVQSDSIGTLTLGVAEHLSVTLNLITTTSESVLDLGIVEDLYSTSMIQSLVESTLSTGFPEELSGNAECVSFINVELTIGAVEVLVSSTTASTTASSGLLITGTLEVLASSTFSLSITDATLTLGVDESLSSSINVESNVSGFIIKGLVELLYGSVDIVSFIRKGGQYSELTLGIVEVLEHSTAITFHIDEPDLILGIIEPLESTYYMLGSSEADALLTTGKIEILESTVIVQTDTTITTEITMGIVEELSGTAPSTIEGGTITGVLTLGVPEDLSSTINIVSVSNADFIIGVNELLASTVATTSDVTLTMILGQDEPLTAGCVVISKVDTFLNLGIAEQLDSSIVITTAILSDVYLGIVEQLSTPVTITTDVSLPELVIGINEILTATDYIPTTVTAILGLGILEVVAATSVTQSNLPGELTIGADEILSSSHLIQSVVNAEITMGADTPLSSSINVVSNVLSLLTIGKAELLATTNFSISVTDASLTLGIDEPLTHTSIIETLASADITMGIDTPVASSQFVTSVVGIGNLVLGVSELLASTTFSISITDATIILGQDEPLSSSIVVQSVIPLTDMVQGVEELMSSTIASTLSSPPAELSFGVGEFLSSTVLVQSYVEDILDLGIYEELSSSIIFTHLTENADLIVGQQEVMYPPPIKIESNAAATWLYVPGVLEELDSTILIQSNVHDSEFLNEEEILTGTSLSNSITDGTLTLGVLELLASPIISISIFGGELELGVPYILDASPTVTTNVYSTTLDLGVDEQLQCTSCVPSTEADGAELIFGAIDVLSSTSLSISITDSELTLGDVQLLSATTGGESKTKGFLQIPGALELLAGPVDLQSVVDVGDNQLILNEVIITGSSNFTHNVESTLFVGGDAESLSSIVSIETSVGPVLMIGGEELLSASISIGSFVEAALINATDLVGTVVIISNVEFDMTIGITEELSSIIYVNTETRDAVLATGNITEVSSSISIVSNIPDVVDIFAALSANCLVELDVVGNIVPGIVELVSGASITISDIISELTLGIDVSIDASIDISTIVDALSPINMQWLNTSIFVDGIVDDIRLLIGYYSGFANSISNSNADLSLFNIEVLVGTSTITTDVSSDLFIGEPVFISSTINVESFIPDTYVVQAITSTSNIQSDVADVHLILGEEGGLSSIIAISSDVSTIFTIGIDTPLSAAINLVSTLSDSIMISSNYIGSTYSETEAWATLTLGVAEHFESGTAHAQSVVNNDGLIIGAIDLYADYSIETNVDAILDVSNVISATALIQSNINVELSVGTVTELEYTAIIETSVIDVELVLGIAEPLNANIFIESHVDGFFYTGIEYGIFSDIHIQSVVKDAELFIGGNSELHSQVHTQSLFITPYLMKGIVEDLSATANIQTVSAPLDILLGAADLLSSSIFSISITDADMIIGIDTDLSSTTIVESSSSGHILMGTTEILSSTGLITSYIGLNANLYIGIALDAMTAYTSNIPITDIVFGTQESLSANIVIRSSANAEYIVGNYEPLFGTVSFDTKSTCSIDIGLATRLAGSAICSINIYDLEFIGIVEPLSSSIHAQSRLDTFLNLGVSNPLESSVNIVQTATSSDLIIGLVEVLSATTAPWVESNSETLWLDIEHKAIVVVKSIIPDVSITMGHLDNSLSTTVVIGTKCTIDPMYFGESEILSANLYAQVLVATELSLGVINETLSSTISLIDIVGTNVELDINTQDRLHRKITADLQYWYDHFVVNHKTLNKHQISFPARDNIYEQSFIELLFNDEYDKTSYRYLYREILDKQSWPDAIKTRMMLDPESAHYYIADGDNPEEYNINLYNIQSHDIVMMDRLLVFRLEPENATLVGIDYDNLDTSLAKMIYIYLELKLTGGYSKYDNSAIFTTRYNSLETCYETYLTQSIFEHVSNKGT